MSVDNSCVLVLLFLFFAGNLELKCGGRKGTTEGNEGQVPD